MKEIQSPYNIMVTMVDRLQEHYPNHNERSDGTIQFHFTHEKTKIDCYIESNNDLLQLRNGIAPNPTVTVKSSFYNWLKLAGGKLNPVLGVMLGKLKFKGDLSFFKILPRKFTNDELGIPKDPISKFEKNPVKFWEKPKKVIVLNASPRGEKGYTDFYLKPFIKGMESKTEVEHIYLKDFKINPCIGCFSCWMDKPGVCIYHDKDGFHELAEKMYKANLIVYAFPIYTDHIPGILKNYFDRSVSRAYPYMINGINGVRHPRKFIQEKQSMFIFSICGFFEKKNFNSVREYFKALAHNRHCPVVGEVYRTTAIGLYGSPFHFQKLNTIIRSLEKAGEQIIQTGKLNRNVNKLIHQKIKTTEDDLVKVNQWWNDKKGSKDLNY
ncbi:MAG: NAD(P)H-dependent oxidoreductase [Bacteroidales bacterium]|nr:NAD(P)H-dependent oxidoreductase [Bacteroidales bacterium]